MSSTQEPQDTYLNITHDTTVDGGWSGQLRVVVATSPSAEPLVFVDSDLLGQRRLVLTAEEALAVADALVAAGEAVSVRSVTRAANSMSAVESTL